MYFGEYLVKKGVVSESDLVRALKIQIERTPPLFSLVVEKKIINETELISIVEFQVEKRISFLEAIREKRKLTDELIQNLIDLQAERMPPLGEILVELKLIDPKNREDLLLEYIEEKGKVPTASETSPEISAAALESLQELIGKGAIDSSALKAFEETSIDFFGEYASSLLSDFESIAKKDLALFRVKNDLHDILKKLEGLFNLHKLKIAEKFCYELSNELTTILHKNRELPKDLVKSSYDLLNDIYQVIKNEGSDVKYWNASGKSAYIHLLRTWKDLAKKRVSVDGK